MDHFWILWYYNFWWLYNQKKNGFLLKKFYHRKNDIFIMSVSWEWGKAGGHKPEHFILPCHILFFFVRQPWATIVRYSMPKQLSLPGAITFLNTGRLNCCGMEDRTVVAHGCQKTKSFICEHLLFVQYKTKTNKSLRIL